MNKGSLERIYPAIEEDSSSIFARTVSLHKDRYRFASEHLRPGLVADIACGAGYGSVILTESNPGIRILAVDNSQEAITYASENYNKPSIRFIHADAMGFKASEPIDTVISLETIEHLPFPVEFVSQMVAQLKPGGRFIASAPITPSMDANPFHLHDFTLDSFKKIFHDLGLEEIKCLIQVQKFNPVKIFRKKREKDRELRKGLFKYYISHPGKFWLRLKSSIKDGFCNKYALVVFQKTIPTE